MVKEIVPDATEDRTIFTKPTKEYLNQSSGNEIQTLCTIGRLYEFIRAMK